MPGSWLRKFPSMQMEHRLLHPNHIDMTQYRLKSILEPPASSTYRGVAASFESFSGMVLSGRAMSRASLYGMIERQKIPSLAVDSPGQVAEPLVPDLAIKLAEFGIGNGMVLPQPS